MRGLLEDKAPVIYLFIFVWFTYLSSSFLRAFLSLYFVFLLFISFSILSIPWVLSFFAYSFSFLRWFFLLISEV